ncbi:MAG TPA: hypothetical protein VLV29_06955 [Steroidobacteraceae bacterium]|nr:hypothetical protein [Steroidobacteraceae bacterium]
MSRRAAVALAVGGLAAGGAAYAFTATLTAAAPKTIYLQIGNGTFTGGNYTPIKGNGQPTGSPGNNATINKVSVSVAAASVGNGTAQAMTTDSTAANSFWDGFAFCNLPQQLYIGGFYRTTGTGTGSVSVIATVPTSLTNAAGDTLPFSQISWTSSGNQDSGAEPFPAGTFSSASLNVGSIGQNQWAESCWTFSYKNTVVPAAGTYTGRVLYTLTAP